MHTKKLLHISIGSIPSCNELRLLWRDRSTSNVSRSLDGILHWSVCRWMLTPSVRRYREERSWLRLCRRWPSKREPIMLDRKYCHNLVFSLRWFSTISILVSIAFVTLPIHAQQQLSFNSPVFSSPFSRHCSLATLREDFITKNYPTVNNLKSRSRTNTA